MLHCLGIDHRRLTYRYMGRDFRLTDVEGEVIHNFWLKGYLAQHLLTITRPLPMAAGVLFLLSAAQSLLMAQEIDLKALPAPAKSQVILLEMLSRY